MSNDPGSWLDSCDVDDITMRLRAVSDENIAVMQFGPRTLEELEALTQSRRLFDIVIVKTIESGLLFPAEFLVNASAFAKIFLAVQGALVFITKDRAAAFIKEKQTGFLSFHVFESFSAVYDYSSLIAKSIQQAMGQSIEVRRESTNLAEQILLTSIPVLTTYGIKLKTGSEKRNHNKAVLLAIDNYTPLHTLAQRFVSEYDFESLQKELKKLEKMRAIYPIFAKIPFLVQNFQNGRQFKLKDYLIESQLLTRDQLDEVQSAMLQTKKTRLSIGSMAVAKGFMSARQLELALQDLSFFGQIRDTENEKVRVEYDEGHVQSLIGNLGTTDAAGVLQNLASNRASGVVVVDYKDQSFKAVFDQGRLTFAKLNKLRANNAVTEFVSVWKEGVFVYMERPAPPDISTEDCKITRPLDKLLLDSALASDNIESVWKKMALRDKSVLEKLPDRQGLLAQTLSDPQEAYELSPDEMEAMRSVWRAADGLSTVSDIIRQIGNVTSCQVAFAISRLIHYELMRVVSQDLSQPLANFRKIISIVSSRIGSEHSEALLKIALRESQGYSAISRALTLNHCEVGVNLAAAKASALSLSNLGKALDGWQAKYVEHAAQELELSELKQLIGRHYRFPSDSHSEIPLAPNDSNTGLKAIKATESRHSPQLPRMNNGSSSSQNLPSVNSNSANSNQNTPEASPKNSHRNIHALSPATSNQNMPPAKPASSNQNMPPVKPQSANQNLPSASMQSEASSLNRSMPTTKSTANHNSPPKKPGAGETQPPPNTVPSPAAPSEPSMPRPPKMPPLPQKPNNSNQNTQNKMPPSKKPERQ